MSEPRARLARRALAGALLAVVSAGAHPLEVDPCPPQDEARAASQSAWSQSGATIASDFVAPAAQVFDIDCLAGIDVLGGLSLYMGFDSLLGLIKQRLCNAANDMIGRINNRINYAATLPYGVAGVNAGGRIQTTPGARVSVPSTSGTLFEADAGVSADPGSGGVEVGGRGEVSTWRDSLNRLFGR